jgi:hypothetical protein
VLALTAGILPNGVGEYAGGIVLWKTRNKTSSFLNLILESKWCLPYYGLLGFVLFNLIQGDNNPNRPVNFRCTNLLFHCLFSIKKIAIKGYSIEKLIQKINEIPKHIQS